MDEKPLIDPKYYQGLGGIDFETMAMAQRFVEDIVKVKPMCEIIGKRVFPPDGLTNGKGELESNIVHYGITDFSRKWYGKLESRLTNHSNGNLRDGTQGRN